MLRPALLAALVGAARGRIEPGDLGVCTALLDQAGCQALADDAGYVGLEVMQYGYTLEFVADNAGVPPGCISVDLSIGPSATTIQFGFAREVQWQWSQRTHATSNVHCGNPANPDLTCYCADEVVLADWGETCADIGRDDLVTAGQCDYAYQLLQEEWGNADEFPDVTTVGNGMTWGDPPVTYMSGLAESPLTGPSACYQTKPAGQTYPGLYSLFFYAGSSYVADPEVRPICGKPIDLPPPSPPPPPLAPFGCPAWDAVGFSKRTDLTTILRADGTALETCPQLKQNQNIEPIMQGIINRKCCGGNSPHTSCRDNPDPSGGGRPGIGSCTAFCEQYYFFDPATGGLRPCIANPNANPRGNWRHRTPPGRSG